MDKIDGLTEIVGSENVIADPATLAMFSSDESFISPNIPSFIVQPEQTEEVQRLLEWANATFTPLIPVSSGPPHFHGDTVPGADEAVIVDLSNMNRIIKVDRKNRAAMIEPGVTFEKLIPELMKNGLKPNMPLLPRCRKSVMGSVLERVPVTMPKHHWDMVDPLACAEIIFGSGDLYRTGSAAGPGTIEEQWKSGGAQKSHAEPLADWCRVIQGAQGTMGIVTWATIRCEAMPVIEEPYLVGSLNLTPLLELVHWLVRLRYADECLILNNVNLTHIMTGQQAGEYEKLLDKLPPWVLFFCIGGYEYYPEEKVSYQIEKTVDIAGRAGVKPVKELNGIDAEEFLKKIQQISDESCWKTQVKGSFQDLFFLAACNRIPGLVEIMNSTAIENGYPAGDMGIYLQPVVQGTSYHCEFNLFFNASNPGEEDVIKHLSIESVKSLMDNGAYFSRPYGTWAQVAYERDAETAISLRKIKSILDPNNIMNPGKLCF